MAAQLLLPDARGRSATAQPGKSDMRTENIYSALRLTHAATGQQKVFTVPQGQTIPALGAVAAATHQATYTEVTTNLTKAGELGASIGDAGVTSIGIVLENGYYSAAGVLNSYGCGQQEVSEVLAKCFFQLKIAGKKQIEGPIFLFPAAGGAFGGISTSANAVTVASLSNGWPGSPKKLKLPILVARSDTLEGVFGVGGGASLSFSNASQTTLVTVCLGAYVAGDVR